MLGYVDDVLLLPGLIWLAIRLTPAHVLAECRARGDEWMAREGAKPRSLWGAGLILAVWAVLACYSGPGGNPNEKLTGAAVAVPYFR